MTKRLLTPNGAAIAPLSGSYFRLLTPGNPKTMKGTTRAYFTFILHLAPATLSGFEVCPGRSTGCTQACLNVSGRGGMMAGVSALTYDMVRNGTRNSIQRARIRKTRLYFEDRARFVSLLVADLRKAIAWAEKHGFTPVFRLNGTSDIRWELASFEGRRLIGDLFSHIQFYDYTKLANRKGIPANYHLTFSLSENNDAQAWQALENGINVAVVYRDKQTVARYEALGLVHNGDESDLRFLDPRGVTALYAKGPAKADTSGFVRD